MSYSTTTKENIDKLRKGIFFTKRLAAPRKEEYETIRVPKYTIPNGAELMECYRYKGSIVVCGDPDDENHNCDMMGCSSASHVLYRFKIGGGGSQQE